MRVNSSAMSTFEPSSAPATTSGALVSPSATGVAAPEVTLGVHRFWPLASSPGLLANCARPSRPIDWHEFMVDIRELGTFANADQAHIETTRSDRCGQPRLIPHVR